MSVLVPAVSAPQPARESLLDEPLLGVGALPKGQLRSAAAPMGAIAGSRLEPWIGPDGLEVTGPNASKSDDPIAKIQLAAFGRSGSLRAVGSGEVASREDRVDILRRGIVEWFVERNEGLEHGFTIDSRPEGTGVLRLELAVEPARATLVGGAVLLTTPQGRSLFYSKLHVVDAGGEPIPSHFEVEQPSRVSLVVDERKAKYPIVIDPILSATVDTSLIADQDSSLFGYSVASAGDVDGDGFDDVIVGAYQYDVVAPGQQNGAAFIFYGSENGVPSLFPSAAATRLGGTVQNQYFGLSVAGAGDVNGDGFDDVIVGSNNPGGQLDEGAAFIFHGRAGRIPSGAAPDTVLQGGQAGAGFGYSVSSAGDVDGDGKDDVIVGAPGYDTEHLGNTYVDAGGAFVFRGTSPRILDADAEGAATRLISVQAGSIFGFSVASAGDVNGDTRSDVIVGARHYSSGQPSEGAAFIFHGDTNGIAHATINSAATTLQSDDPDGQLFDVASAGDLNGDGFDDVVVGIPFRASTDEGGVFVYLGGQNGIANGGAASAIILVSEQYFAHFGSRAASAGDVNGDGFSDLVVGASYFDMDQADEGAVFLFLGQPDVGITAGFSSIAFRRLEVDDPGALLGTSVASAGDVDGDGFSDVIAGAPYHGPTDSGAAFVWTGADTGVDRDGDGLTDAQERLIHQTNPLVADSDGDYLSDGEEVSSGLDPRDASDPPVLSAPLVRSGVSIESLSGAAFYRVSLAGLPTRPILQAEATPDAAHSDMDLEVSISRCTIKRDSTQTGLSSHPDCRQSTTAIASSNQFPGIDTASASYRPWMCRPQVAYPSDTCIVAVRPRSLGGNSALPFNFDLSVSAHTDVPTSTIGTSVNPLTYEFGTFGSTNLYQSHPEGSNGAGQSRWVVAGTGSNAIHVLFWDAYDQIRYHRSVNQYAIGNAWIELEVLEATPGATFEVMAVPYDGTTGWSPGSSDAPGDESVPGPPVPGAATWSHLSWNDIPWTTPGGDRVTPALVSVAVSGPGVLRISSPALLEHIREISRNDLPNGPGYQGYLLVPVTGAVRLAPYQTILVRFLETQTPIGGNIPTGPQPFFDEAQNFRWIYDLEGDRVAFTPIEGRCEWTPRPFEPEKQYELPFTYDYLGLPGYSGADCCTWQITSTTGVTGSGQAIFFVGGGGDPNALSDSDQDGIKDVCDNCIARPNGPFLGTCLYGPRKELVCRSNQDCLGSLCSQAQQDSDQDRTGDVCAVPEPSTTGSLMIGSALVRALARRRRPTSSGG